MNLDPELYGTKIIPFVNVKTFLQETLPQLEFSRDYEEEVVLDAGCGTGGTTFHLVLPLFPQLENLYAIDALPNMIHNAEICNSHPMIEYSVADIEKWPTVKKWECQITKLVSIYCLQWLKDAKKGFRNIYRLLKPGGKAAICFPTQSIFYEAMKEMENNSKWRSYYKEVGEYISDAHLNKRNDSYYEQMVKEIGFEIVYLNEVSANDAFSSDEAYKNFFSSICVVLPHVPVNKKEEFKNELFEEMIKLGGRANDGLPIHKSTVIHLDTGDYLPDSHVNKRNASYYEQMIKEVGFEILHLKEESTADVFSSEEVYKNLYSSICVVLSHIPVNKREEFKNELFEEMIKLGGSSSDGLPVHRSIAIELVIRKNEQ
ncbi:juvenile hormone acid O-methyltransferase [Caerostris darwini]|uniref:Juvenile hormone acid O-methyltransferase n=1 Tax=Caerostris darwini TaxID=1538125 RepID=A0AAV4R0I0_9ARAC|nr:juvenile hormone acid O-methyltransferase [Caerostris darwini]